MNPRAGLRLDELELIGFPTTYFDGGYGEILGGSEDTSIYTTQLLSTGIRDVSTDFLYLQVELDWLGGEGGPADDIEITVTIEVGNSLSFTFPSGIPVMVTPDEETTYSVVVNGTGTGAAVPGTGKLYCSMNGGSYATISMPETAANEYEATLPAIPCGSTLDFYLSAEETTSGVIYYHREFPFHVYPSNEIDTIFADDFESDLGWIVSGGQWERGAPTGGGGDYGFPDPTSAHSGTNELGYNLNGDYSDNMPEYHVTSPAINCHRLHNAELRFWRWLNAQRLPHDRADVKISSDGVSWTTIWENERPTFDTEWIEQVFDISAHVDEHSQVYLRFTMGPTDSDYTSCGWNIDDITIVGEGCDGPYICGDGNDDRLVNIADAVYLIQYIFGSGAEPYAYFSGDVNCDTLVNITDAVYLITYIFNSGPPPCDTDHNGAPDC